MITTPTSCDAARILLVDDNPTNLKVLSEALRREDWTTLVATDGESAIQQICYAQPDLILLDVMMPGIDGFETCRRLKQNEATEAIPVIFMTALSDVVDKVKGLQLGAVDYITKPFQQDEVLARVKLHLKLYRLNQQLNQKIAEQALTEAQLSTLNQELEQRVEERTAELAASLEAIKTMHLQLIQNEKMASVGQLVAGVAHEINNPVNFIYGNLTPAGQYIQDLLDLINLYKQEYPDSKDVIQNKEEEIDLEFLQDDLTKLLASMKLGVDRIRAIVLSLRNFSRLDEAEYKAVDIHEGIESTLVILENRIKAKPERPAINVIKEFGDLPLVECYAGQLNQVFMNILANAIDALDERDQHRTFEEAEALPSCIWIRTAVVEPDRISIVIEDNGPGLSEEVKKRIFDPFFTTKPVGKGTGIGMSISYQIITDKHAGKLECLSSESQGAKFLIEIPRIQHLVS